MDIKGVNKEIRGDAVELVSASLDNLHPQRPSQHQIHIGSNESAETWVREILSNLEKVSGLPKAVKNKLELLSKPCLSDKDHRSKLESLKKLISYKVPSRLSGEAKRWRKLGFYFICTLLSHNIGKVSDKDVKFLEAEIGKEHVTPWYLKHVISQLHTKMGCTKKALKWEKAALKSFVQLDREAVIKSITDIPFEERLEEEPMGYLAMGGSYEDHQNYNCAIISYSRALKKDPTLKELVDQQITKCIELKKLRFNRNIQELKVYEEHQCQK